MAPVLAFGPSLWFVTGGGGAKGPFVSSVEWSMVPSGLLFKSANVLAIVRLVWTRCGDCDFGLAD